VTGVEGDQREIYFRTFSFRSHTFPLSKKKQKPTTYTCGSAGGKAVSLLPNDNGYVITKLDVGCAPLQTAPGLGISAG
jgi:hypothetical protein